MVKESDIPDNFDFTFPDGGSKYISSKMGKHSSIQVYTMCAGGYVDASDNDLMSTKWYNKTNKVG